MNMNSYIWMYLSRSVFYNVEDRQLLSHTLSINKKKKDPQGNWHVTSVISDSLSTGSVSPTLAYRITQTQSSMVTFYLNLKEADTYHLFYLIKISNLVTVKCYFSELPFQKAFITEKFTQTRIRILYFFNSLYWWTTWCRMKDSAPFLKPPVTKSSSFGLAEFPPMQVCLTDMKVS